MDYNITAIPDFKKQLKALSKRHSSIVSDLQHLIADLKENPFIGVEIAPGLRKIRMAISSKGRGKSGGARVITYTIVMSESEGELYLVALYDKADHSTVDVALLRRLIADLP